MKHAWCRVDKSQGFTIPACIPHTAYHTSRITTTLTVPAIVAIGFVCYTGNKNKIERVDFAY